MSHPLRIHYKGAWYHIIDRCCAHRTLFPSTQLRQEFLKILADTSTRYHFEVHAYCLLENEIHFLVRMPEANLSRAMHRLFSLYAVRYNRYNNTHGPLFRDRYKSILVEDDEHILKISRYLHRLPKTQMQLPVISNYLWSSYLAYIGLRQSEDWLVRTGILHFLAKHNAEALYRIYVETGADEELKIFYGRKKISAVLGSREFKINVAKKNNP